jgi:hypothetical protein
LALERITTVTNIHPLLREKRRRPFGRTALIVGSLLTVAMCSVLSHAPEERASTRATQVEVAKPEEQVKRATTIGEVCDDKCEFVPTRLWKIKRLDENGVLDMEGAPPIDHPRDVLSPAFRRWSEINRGRCFGGGTQEQINEWCDALWITVTISNPTLFAFRVWTECTVYDRASHVIGHGINRSPSDLPANIPRELWEAHVPTDDDPGWTNFVRIPKIKLDDIGNVVCKSRGKRS